MTNIVIIFWYKIRVDFYEDMIIMEYILFNKLYIMTDISEKLDEIVNRMEQSSFNVDKSDYEFVRFNKSYMPVKYAKKILKKHPGLEIQVEELQDKVDRLAKEKQELESEVEWKESYIDELNNDFHKALQERNEALDNIKIEWQELDKEDVKSIIDERDLLRSRVEWFKDFNEKLTKKYNNLYKEINNQDNVHKQIKNLIKELETVKDNKMSEFININYVIQRLHSILV